jgi:hypothetical protein
MTDNEPVLTAAIQAVYLDVIAMGDKVAAENREHLKAVIEHDKSFMNELTIVLESLKEENVMLSMKHSNLMALAEEQFNAYVRENRLAAENALQRVAEGHIANFSKQASMAIVELTKEGLAEAYGSIVSMNEALSRYQENAQKSFIAVTKAHEETVQRTSKSMENSVNRLEARLSSASEQVSWSWKKILAIAGTTIALAIMLGFVGGNWLLARIPSSYPKEVRRALNDGLFLERFWNKLDTAEQNVLKKLAESE